MSVVRVRGWSVRFRARALLVGLGCALAAGALGVVSIGGGDYPMSPADVLRTLAGGGTPAEDFIIGELRLPRLVTALLVGAALALGGAVFQALVRNPLGSPDILGVTQGAATGALLVVVVGGGTLALAGAAVAGGLATGVLLWAVAWARGAHGHRLILAGIGVAAILTGVNGWLLTRAQLMDAARAVLWLTGSLDGRGWAQAVPVAVTLAVAVPVVLFACGPALRMTELGDDTAAALGVPVRGLRTTLLVAAVLLVSVAASAAGPVNFVALTAPHLTRRLTRAPGPNLAAAMALGAAMLVAADLIAQRGFPGHQLPVGVVTGALGGGYLVWLLATERRAGRL